MVTMIFYFDTEILVKSLSLKSKFLYSIEKTMVSHWSVISLNPLLAWPILIVCSLNMGGRVKIFHWAVFGDCFKKKRKIFTRPRETKSPNLNQRTELPVQCHSIMNSTKSAIPVKMDQNWKIIIGARNSEPRSGHMILGSWFFAGHMFAGLMFIMCPRKSWAGQSEKKKVWYRS